MSNMRKIRTDLDELVEFLAPVHTEEDNDINEQLAAEFSMQDTSDQHIGDILMEHKPPNTLRIYCINLNGLKWDQHGGN